MLIVKIKYFMFKTNELFSKKYYEFCFVIIFIGLFPLLIHPFSRFYGQEDDWKAEGWNHGPLHEFSYTPPADIFHDLIDSLISLTFFWPIFFMVAISIIMIVYYFFQLKIKKGLIYFIPAFVAFFLLLVQYGVLFWLYD